MSAVRAYWGRQFVGAAATIAMAGSSLPALASTLTDLEGVRASAAETTIKARGYRVHHSAPAGNGRYTYWWNNSSNSCVRTLTSEGVISATKTLNGSDCGHAGNSGSSSDTAAAAALAAAAIIGVAALSHKSHNRNDREYENPNQYADFERGHRDGLYNHSYSNYNRSDTYSDGYRSGVEERGQQSRYRQGNYYRGGYQSSVQVGDLDGQNRNYAIGELSNRGFARVNEYKISGGHNYVFWNPTSLQCVSLTSRNDYVRDVHEVSDSACR